MYLAVSQEFRARWSDQIHDEWIRNLLLKRPDINADQLARTRALMDENVLGALVTGFESLIPSINLPDEDDRHVVAVAIQSGAEAIITFNLKDFPDSALAAYGITAMSPDDFIADLMELNSSVVIEAARNHRCGLKHPAFSASEYLDLLLKQKLPRTVNMLKKFEMTI
jgi:predicted nucleic acid-binding protein